MKIYTIGFAKKSAEKFFSKLCEAGVKRLIDIRLNNVSQLAGFTKKDDLRFFLRKICDIDYLHKPELAPTKEILDEYKKQKNDWAIYESKFIDLMKSRMITEKLDPNLFDNSCLLCSEDQPNKCHRRLVAEYLKDKWNDIEIIHLI